MNAHTDFKTDPVLTAASNAAKGDRTKTTTHLLRALSKHEGSSDLGLLIGHILGAGDFHVRSYREDFEASITDAEEIVGAAEGLAEEYRRHSEYMLQGDVA